MKILPFLALAFALASAPAAAKPDAGVVQLTVAPQSLSPSRAYILMRVSTAKSGILEIHPVMLRVPTEAELADYRAAKEKAYNEAKPKLIAQAKGTPIPTLDQFSFAYPGRANTFVVESGKNLAAGDMRTVLLEADPGTYVFYGATLGGAGLITCNCLGTLSFDAPPGVITDVGSLFTDKVHKPSPYRQLESNIGPTMFQYAFIFGQAVEPANAQTTVPPAIGSLPRRLAQFHVVAPYYEGAASINRLAPIPGVLEYRHGRPVDPNARPAP